MLHYATKINSNDFNRFESPSLFVASFGFFVLLIGLYHRHFYYGLS